MKARLAVTVLALAAALGATGATGAPPASLRVLFVGNSLTASNDLPATVAGIAAANGRRLEYRTVAPGGFALEDHWSQGEARAALETGRWDVVVMQQGPSALPESQANLREWATRWAVEARRVGTRPALLTVWPESYRRSALTEVIASYARAARAARADLLPGGSAWRLAWHCDPGTPLYGPDGFHPSRPGTYAAALVVYGRLFRAPLLNLKAPAGISPRIARRVQAAAARALGRPVPRARRCGA
jgi:hypothetical protein